MNKILELNYNKGLMYQGFRSNRSFLSRHKKTLQFVSDTDWNNAKYMNKTYNISSPTRNILGQYFICILTSLLMDYAKDKVNMIQVNVPADVKLDPYSKKILDILSNNTEIKITQHPSIKAQNDVLNPENMRISIKRGLYDDFDFDNKELTFMYKYFKSVFLNKKTDLNLLINKYNQIKDNYIKWLVIKAIINKAIRENQPDIVTEYLIELKKYKLNKFDYWNSKSFYLLVYHSKNKSINYLKNRIDINSFLNSSGINYAESLVMKNYATILDNNKYKKQILYKCLTQTPQDVDLIKLWNHLYGTKKDRENFAINAFENGYVDLELLKDIKLYKGMDELITKAILVASSKDENKEICISLANNLVDKKLKNTLIDILETDDLKSYILGEK
ncbi:hypothetical protein [Lactobacillus helveticus]|nr:hypothetical protein [Lactobacillus helveticus]POO27295.1 hypothetical protein CDA64_01660 [Lactobacillus helveticus]GFP07942.1 hypothetical protein LHEJCM1006_00880 [Lactobacillus helveticus]GFP17019.1 hypothetical protein LHEJCM20397_05670 [Lactobacillus helveticus]GIP67622.1 hypothetical protein LhelvAHU1049_18270 [Lactobacillus helveticus]